VSATDVWAVGRSLTSTGVAQTLIEHWDGRNWSVVTTPNASAQNNLLAGVTAISANDVWAVGDFQTTSGAGTVFQTLTEHWNGTAWSIVASPNGAGPGAGLNGVAAVSASDVWAVGDSGSGTLIEQWNGTSWAVVPSPNPSTAVFNTLSGAALTSASDIWAGGPSPNSGGIPAPPIEQWNRPSRTPVTRRPPGSPSPARRPAQHPSPAAHPPTQPPGRPGPWAPPPPRPPAAPPKRSPSSTPTPPAASHGATPVTRVTTNNGTEYQPDMFPQDLRG